MRKKDDFYSTHIIFLLGQLWVVGFQISWLSSLSAKRVSDPSTFQAASKYSTITCSPRIHAANNKKIIRGLRYLDFEDCI